jgi:hypothetical protein
MYSRVPSRATLPALIPPGAAMVPTQFRQYRLLELMIFLPLALSTRRLHFLTLFKLPGAGKQALAQLAALEAIRYNAVSTQPDDFVSWQSLIAT